MNDRQYFEQFSGLGYDETYILPSGEDRITILTHYLAGFYRFYTGLDLSRQVDAALRKCCPVLFDLDEDRYFEMRHRIITDTLEQSTEAEQSEAWQRIKGLPNWG